MLDTASGYCVGVKKDDTELQKAIQGALEAITGNGVVGVIEDKWLGGAISLEGVQKVEAKAPAADANGAEGEGSEGSEEEDAEASNSSDASTNASN